MGLDSLLARMKTDVSAVSGVQASNDGACIRYGTKSADVSAVSIPAISDDADTSDTSLKRQTYQAKPLLSLVCTSDTSDTSQNTVTADDAVSWGWLLHFADRDSIMATFSPEATHAEALACYPDAVAAEPMTNAPSRAPTDSEAALLRVLIEAVYRDDGDDDRNEAMQSALADPRNALTCYRAIASEHGLTLPDADDRRTCRECSNLRGATCSVATPGGALSAQRGYRPGALWQDEPHRCDTFNERGN